MRLISRFLLLVFLYLSLATVSAQEKLPDPAYFEIKDSIIARYNRQDFKGIYQLADTGFKRKISEAQLIRFMTGNFSTGKIISSELYKRQSTAMEFLLKCQARDMILVLDINTSKQITTFGFKGLPISLRADTPVACNNLKITALDKSVDSIAREYFRFPNAAALSIGLLVRGQAHSYHYGYPDKIKTAIPDDETVYQIASLSKTFTATLLAHAVLEGKVTLDDDIRQYLPGTYPNLAFEGMPVKIIHLANHTSGFPVIPDNLDRQLFFDPLNPFAHYSQALFLDAISRIQLVKAPGTDFTYSNMGMALVAIILEKVYGMTYDDLLAKYITGPLGMNHTSVQLTQQQKKRLATPYANNGNIVPIWDMGICAGAGGISSNTTDMLKYLAAEISEKDPAILLTHQPTMHSTGLGWGVRTLDGKRDLLHNGSAVGFRSNITLYPDQQSAMVVMVNNDSDNSVINKLIADLQRVLMSQ